MAAKAMWVVQIAKADDDEYTRVDVTAREMLKVERQVKGFTVAAFFRSINLIQVYRVLFIVLTNRGELPEGMTLAQFEDTYDVSLRDPDEETSEDSENDDASGVDPTQTTP